MPFLPDAAVADYLAHLTEEQVASIRAIRELVLKHCPHLNEEIDTGKWFGGLLTYNSSEVGFIYALGPRAGGATTFHMMPYYSSKSLQERYGEAFKPVLTGKSCIQFKRQDQIPLEAIKGLLESTPDYIESAKIFFAARNAKKK
jgi:hypothetical protein